MTRKMTCPDCGDPKKPSDFYYSRKGFLVSPKCKHCFNERVKLNGKRRELNRKGIIII